MEICKGRGEFEVVGGRGGGKRLSHKFLSSDIDYTIFVLNELTFLCTFEDYMCSKGIFCETLNF